jgi:hypothetical protein
MRRSPQSPKGGAAHNRTPPRAIHVLPELARHNIERQSCCRPHGFGAATLGGRRHPRLDLGLGAQDREHRLGMDRADLGVRIGREEADQLVPATGFDFAPTLTRPRRPYTERTPPAGACRRARTMSASSSASCPVSSDKERDSRPITKSNRVWSGQLKALAVRARTGFQRCGTCRPRSNRACFPATTSRPGTACSRSHDTPRPIIARTPCRSA